MLSGCRVRFPGTDLKWGETDVQEVRIRQRGRLNSDAVLLEASAHPCGTPELWWLVGSSQLGQLLCHQVELS